MRLFFAAFPDPGTCRTVAAAALALELPGRPRYLPPENYHVTILFLGEVSDSQIESILEIGEAQRVGCSVLRFDRWEYWEDARAVVATSADRPQSLLSLRSMLAAGLAQRGIGFDDKPRPRQLNPPLRAPLKRPLRPQRAQLNPPLRPHITVARKIAQAPVLQALSEFSCEVRAFSLVASVTASGGSVYTVVGTWPLLDTASRD
jgi:2'-5' RNA ligase